MGKVIALPLSRKIATVQPEGAAAKILFFTGVRYYRMSEEEFAKFAAPMPQRRTKSKTAASKVASSKLVASSTAVPARKLRKLA